MAQPRDYTRQYNFNDFQTTNPDDPLPGPQVDGELDAVKLTLDDLNANIGKIQRDDGKLKNASVHKDSFSQDALAIVNSDFTPRGDWATATSYAVNDAVDFNGATYVATVAHTSSAAFSTDDAADRWILIANAAISGTGSAVDKFEGDGNTTSFTLTYTYTSETAVQVFVNGELLNPVDDYTLSGNTLTLYTAPGLPTVAGNENVIVWGASVVAQAAAQDASGHESNASGYADESEAWASQTSGIVESTDYSSKAYAIGGTGVDTGAGSAKDWATKTSGTVGNTTEYSSKYWATQGNVPIVAQNISDINTVAGISSDVTTVANNDANVTTVAGIDGNVTTVAGISGDVTTVAGNNANVTTLAGLNTQITTLGAISTDISTVSGISANTTTVAGVSTDVTTVAGISGNVSTVAGISSNVTTVALANANVTAIATDLTGTNTIGTTAGSIANVNIVANAITNVNSAAQNMSDINTVATEINNNNLQTVANDIQAVITTANDLNEATSEIDTVANSIANVDLVGGSISNVNTVAANLTDVNAFFDTYAIGATAPSSPTTGDLWFDTSTSTMKVYSGSGFINAGSSVNGTAARFVYTATAAQTTFTGADDGNNTLAYDAGFVDIYMNGVKLAPADYTASNGTSIVLASGAALNDVIEIVAYGTFTLANLSLNDLTDVSTTGRSDHDILAYNVANQQFEARSTAVLTGLTMQGNAYLRDNDAVYFGTSLDSYIYHDGTSGHTYFRETGSGSLIMQTNTFVVQNAAGTQNIIMAPEGANGIDFSYDGNVKLSTASNGIQVNGSVTLNEASAASHGAATKQLTASGNGYYQDLRFSANEYEFRYGPSAWSAAFTGLKIDSNGNVLIGKTTTGLSVTGTQITSDGRAMFTRDGNQAADFARKTSDGEIIKLHKDSSLVGVIGTVSGELFIGTGSTGFYFDASNTSIKPRNVSSGTGSGTDGNIDLGGTGNRFRDIHLSGTSYANNTQLDLTPTNGDSPIAVKIVNNASGTGTGGRVVMGAGGGSLSQTAGVAGFFDGTGTSLAFYTSTSYGSSNQTERARINRSGTFLVGTTNADVAFSTSAGSALQPSGQTHHSANGTALILNRTSGDGTTAQFRQGGTTKGDIQVTSSGVTYNTTSDRRLKDNIATITDGTEKLMAMNPVTHTWINDPSADAVHGFIAQEMQEIVPEAVSGDPDSQDMMSMDYGRITPVLVAALQDAHKKIEALEERLAELEAK